MDAVLPWVIKNILSDTMTLNLALVLSEQSLKLKRPPMCHTSGMRLMLVMYFPGYTDAKLV